MMRRIVITAILVVFAGVVRPAMQSTSTTGGHTTVYFVRHAESDEADPSNPTHPLTAKGAERARILASTLREAHLTEALNKSAASSTLQDLRTLIV